MIKISNLNILGYDVSDDNNIAYITPEGILEFNPEQENSAFVKTMDAQEKWTLMPGLLDAHVHGYGGHDFSNATADEIETILHAIGKTGVSYCFATLVSLSLPKLQKALLAINEYMTRQEEHPTQGSANIVGVHLEGPFIATCCKGAHDEQVLQKSISIELFEKITHAAPNITQWKITISPDIEGAIEFIRKINIFNNQQSSRYVQVYIGHTNASEYLIGEAIKAGAEGFTHLGNANKEQMTRNLPFSPQNFSSNVLKWVAKNSHTQFDIELIHDNQHISKAFGSYASDLKRNSLILVTDALGPSGIKDSEGKEYKLGELTVLKKGLVFVLKSDPQKLAGSAASLPQIIHSYCNNDSIKKLSSSDKMKAIYSATVKNPRKHLKKLDDQANFVIFDEKGTLVLSVCNKKITINNTKTVMNKPSLFSSERKNSGDENKEKDNEFLPVMKGR